MKTVICFFFLILFSVFAKAQILTSLDSLIVTLQNHHDSLKLAQVIEYKESKKWNWLYCVPGLGYDFISNRPMISYNVTHIASYLKNNEQSKYKKLSIEKSQKLDYESDLIKLRTLYQDINIRISQFALDTLIYFKHKQLFQIYESKYKNNEILLENYLQDEIAMLEKGKAIATTKNTILSLIGDLQILVNAIIQYKI